jgi:drug/metabolite transporter (DMT)-like permease
VNAHGNALLALVAAAAWGGGDFSGGMGVRAAGGSTRAALRFILLSHLSSLAVLTIVLWLRHQPIPHGALLGWGLSAGFSGGISLTAFYLALSRGEMGVSAAVSGLLAAAIPALVSTGMEGAPGALRLAGFLLALVAIWVIAAGPSPENSGGKATLGLAVLSGAGFGIYFVALRMANPLGVVMPMALARVGSLVTCSLMLLALRISRVRKPQEPERMLPMPGVVVLWALSSALLDTAGNMLFVGATLLGRLDVAAVLASLYPAGTILLAAWRLHEKPTRRQVAGMLAALAAVVMITL